MKDRIKLNNKKSRITKFNIPSSIDTVAELIALMSDGIYNDSDPNNATTGDNVGVSAIGTFLNKAELDPMTIITFTHTKSGSNHELSNADGGVNIRFVATGRFEAGDTITVNGTSVTIQTASGESPQSGYFDVGAIVLCSVAENCLTLVSCGTVKRTYTATISATWTGSAAPYTQDVAIAGILATDAPHITPVYADTLATAVSQKEAWGMVSEADAGAGKIVFACFEDRPTVAIPIQVEVMR